MNETNQHPALTLFAIPKPFLGHIGVIQRNALESWRRLSANYEIILFGSEAGTEEVASEFGLVHVPEVATNNQGTPLVSDLFDQAQRVASADILAYVNADIILTRDFTPAVADVVHKTDRFLIVGQRWGIDIREPWDFELPEWEHDLRTLVEEKGSLGSRSALDYFVFSRGLFGAIPPFAIGRMAWDNWLVFRARQRNAMVVDATEQLTAVHQNHEYSGTSSKNNPLSAEVLRQNQKLMGAGYGDLDYVTHLLRHDGLHRAWTMGELLRNPRRLVGRYAPANAPVRFVRNLFTLSLPVRAAWGLSLSGRGLKKS